MEGGDVYEILTPTHPPPPKKGKTVFVYPQNKEIEMGFVGGGGLTAVHYATAQVNFFLD